MTSIFIFTALLLIVATGIIVLVLIYRNKQLQYISEKQQLKITYEKEILASKLEIQEQTFKNIAQEIHDNIGPKLTLAKLHINNISSAGPDQLLDKINDSKQLISKALQDLRDLSKSFHTDHIKKSGLSNSIEYELQMIKKTGEYDIQFDVNGTPYRLNEQQELVLFRVVQEALHNIIKHAKATIINVLIIFDPQIFTLKITDNGVGFETAQMEDDGSSLSGLGLRNMYNRAKMINTEFTLTSAIDEGTIILLTLPL